jgi:fructose-bisphosphate aldolase class II
MPLVLDRNHVLDVYAEAGEKQWVLPTFNTENLTSCEAILSAARKFSEQKGIDRTPVIIGITNNYPPRSQSRYYTHTRQWDLGMKLFLNNLKVLTEPGSPFCDLDVLIHLDHIQWDTDVELLQWNMDRFSSIMYDASTLPIKENIEKTRQFAELNKHKVLVEAACDEISNDVEDLTSPESAEQYFRETGIDILTVNLGTEHRATSSSLQYRDDHARLIKERLGCKLCLHGTSSIPVEKLKNLYKDGICKVNIWTTLERDSVPDLFRNMLENASSVVGPDIAQQWRSAGLLGSHANVDSQASLEYYTTTYRQELIFNIMQEIVLKYLNLWYT